MGEPNSRGNTGIQLFRAIRKALARLNPSRGLEGRRGNDQDSEQGSTGTVQHVEEIPHEDGESCMGISLCLESYGGREVLVFRVPACSHESGAIIGVHSENRPDQSSCSLVKETVARWVQHCRNYTSSDYMGHVRDLRED